jgi:hypothetical protein
MAKAAKRKTRAASLSKKRATKAKKKKTAASARSKKASAKTKKTPAKRTKRTAGGKRRAGSRTAARHGDLLIQMPGGFRTCGGFCADPVPRHDKGDPMGEDKIWCDPQCDGEVAKACACRLYSYPTPKKGDPPPPKKEWKKEPDTKIVPEDGRTYKCVCVAPN